MTIQGNIRAAIDRCFCHNSVAQIVAALEAEAEGGNASEWATSTLKILHERSPTSVYVTLRLLRLGRRWMIGEAFQREYILAGKFMAHPDFTEGVTAKLINKPPTQPKWSPASLADMTDAKVDEFFKMEGLERLPLLNPSAEYDYREYPFAHLALPSEGEIERVVRMGEMTRAEVVQHFEHQRDGKLGVRAKVNEVLRRKTTVNEAEKCAWIAAE